MTRDKPKPELVQFARWLRGELRARRISGNALALKLGVSKGGVSEYARAIRRPRLETLRKMAAELDTPLEDLEALLPSDEAPARSLVYGSVDAAPVADWLKDPDLRVMFYGITHDLTPEEIESIKPILWKEYLAILARRGEGHAGGGPAGTGSPS